MAYRPTPTAPHHPVAYIIHKSQPRRIWEWLYVLAIAPFALQLGWSAGFRGVDVGLLVCAILLALGSCLMWSDFNLHQDSSLTPSRVRFLSGVVCVLTAGVALVVSLALGIAGLVT